MADEQAPVEEGMDPLGFEFFAGQGVVILGVVMGVLLAARFGFSSAVALTDRQDAHRALTVLHLVDAELTTNLGALTEARDALAAGRAPHVTIDTRTLESVAGKPYLAGVDPRVLADVEKLLAYPIPEVVAALANPNGPLPEERDRALIEIDAALAKAQGSVLPRLRAEEARLDALAGDR